MTDKRVLVCWRVADWEPQLQSVVDKCASCGAAIWVALSSPHRARKVCMQCGWRAFAAQDVKVEPITKRQLADIKKARR